MCRGASKRYVSSRYHFYYSNYKHVTLFITQLVILLEEKSINQ